MQLTPQKGNIVEKILRDAQGQLVRATFCIYEQNGRVKARLVSAVLIENQKALTTKPLCLSGTLAQQTVVQSHIFVRATVSPFFTTSVLHTSGSKPRAPTF